MKFSVNSLCPCGSKKKYKKCCKIFHDGTAAKNALELMKSRYSAYAVANIKYLISTTHPDNPQYNPNKIEWGNDIKEFCQSVNFISLDIIEYIKNEDTEFVTFRANIKDLNNNDISFVEKSRFVKYNNLWKYIDGEFL